MAGRRLPRWMVVPPGGHRPRRRRDGEEIVAGSAGGDVYVFLFACQHCVVHIGENTAIGSTDMYDDVDAVLHDVTRTCRGPSV